MMEPVKPVVVLIDDDPEITTMIGRLLDEVALPLRAYTRAEDYLEAHDPSQPGCLLIDVLLPGMNGMQLLEWNRWQKPSYPAIVITAHADVPLAVQAMKTGAMDVLEKPFRLHALLDAIHRALAEDAERRVIHNEREKFQNLLARLTPRESEVLELFLTGKPQKQIATQLGISRKTLDAHRANLMRKLQVDNVVDLVRLCLQHPGSEASERR